MTVHISYPSKVACPAIGLPPVVSCPGAVFCRGSVCSSCYARNGTGRRYAVKRTLAENWRLLQTDHNAFFDDVDSFVAETRPAYFRWQWSGDIPDIQYLFGMMRIARHNPSTRFLCFTKSLAELGVRKLVGTPDNLVIRVSLPMIDQKPIRGMAPDTGAGVAFVVTQAFVQAARRSGWPRATILCPGDCSTCRVCWGREGNVAFLWHGDACARNAARAQGVNV